MSMIYSTPPIAGDSEGAISVLSSFGGVHILYGPKGCLAAVRAMQTPEELLKAKIVALDLRETDAVLGADDALCERITEFLRAYPNAPFVSIIGSPIPAVSSASLRQLAKRIEVQLSKPVLAIETTGFSSCFSGMHQTWVALFERFLSPATRRARSVNILGASRLGLGVSADISPIIDLLQQMDLSVNCVFDSTLHLERFQSSPQAAFNLVLSHEALGLAELYRSHFGIPFSMLFPAGYKGMRELTSLLARHFSITIPSGLQKHYSPVPRPKHLLRAAVIASPSVALGLRDCLLGDWGYQSVQAIAYLPDDHRETRNWWNLQSEDLVLAEDTAHIRHCCEKTHVVFADPAFADLFHDKQFIPTVQPSVSGLLYEGNAHSLIGAFGHEYLQNSLMPPSLRLAWPLPYTSAK